MKNKNLFAGISIAGMLVVGAISPSVAKQVDLFRQDEVVYDDPRFVDYEQPDFVYNAPLNADVVSPTSVSIHYHNNDNDCSSRELWIWCDGVNGSAFAPVVTNGGADMEVSFSFTGEYANFANKKSLSFIVKYTIASGKGGGDGWTGKSANMLLSYTEFPPNSEGKTEVWCIPGEGDSIEMYESRELTEMDRFVSASFNDDWKTITVLATAQPTSYKLYGLTSYYMNNNISERLEDYLICEGAPTSSTAVDGNRRFTINLNHTIKPNVQYLLEGVFPEYPTYKKTKYVGAYNLYESEFFNSHYLYEGSDLGVTYSKSSTTFKVWAPTAASVRVRLYKSGSPSDYIKYDPTATDWFGGYNMVFRPGGVWEVTVTNKDLNGMYYTYEVYNSLGQSETIDPYAKACGIDGKRAMILDFSQTNPDGWDKVPLRWDGVYRYDINTPNELSIYETHIRDLTMDESWTGESMPGTYSAFAEKGTTYTKDGVTVKTGFDHIEELGVKAVQLIPVFDSANTEGLGEGERSYNWGYNPDNYNCVEGSYSTNPYDGAARIKEYKQLIQNYAKNANHTRIIMDVVYNHVNSISSHPFQKLMPRYYFRYEPTSSSPYNGSGCGNEVKTEAPMMRKYMVESLCWWAKEYKIKGFRFDLMGLIDWQAIKAAAKELYKIDPDIYLYGEGWTGDGSESGNIDNGEGRPYYNHWGANTWTVYNKLQKESDMCYVGAFNNYGRDAIAGETGKYQERGFIDLGSGDVGGISYPIANMLAGYHSPDENWKDPNQCVNYASCHDDFSLFDHLTYGVGSGYPAAVCAATAAVESTIMYSNGAAFIRGGEEIFQNKRVSDDELDVADPGRVVEINGVNISSNSYNLSDYTNAFRWDRKISIDGVSVKQYYDAIKDAVNARKNMKRYSKTDLSKSSPYSSVSELYVWGQGNGSTIVCMRNGDFYFFVNGISDGNISFSSISTHNQVVFLSNPAEGGYVPNSTGLKLGWYTAVCLTK